MGTPCTGFSSSKESMCNEVSKEYFLSIGQSPKKNNMHIQLDDLTFELTSASDNSLSEMDESFESSISQSTGRNIVLDTSTQHSIARDHEIPKERFESDNQSSDEREIEIEFKEWDMGDDNSLDEFCPIPNEITTILDQRFRKEVRTFNRENETLKRELELQKRI